MSCLDVVLLAEHFKYSKSFVVIGISTHIIRKVIKEIAESLASHMSEYVGAGVSILTVLGKTIEVIMKIELVKYLEREEYCPQHGFRRGRLTVTALASLVGNLYETFLDGDSITMIMFNLRIAFHVPPHNILPGILDLYGERVVALRTFSSYLNERTQVVSMSALSVLLMECPILFLVATNDIDVFLDAVCGRNDSTWKREEWQR